MYIPFFSLRERERDIIRKNYSCRIVELKEGFNFPIRSYLLEDNKGQEVLNFVEEFRAGLNEDNEKSNNRNGILRAVTLIFNLLIKAQQIKDPEIKISTMASISAAVINLMVLDRDYGIKLMSVVKSRL